MIMQEKVKVSLASEDNRYDTIFTSLDLIKKEINDEIALLDGKEDYILVKPNCLAGDRQLCATHVDALRATLHFICSLWQGRLILAEGSAMGSTIEAFRNYKYEEMKLDFPNLEFLDLNYSDAVNIDVVDNDLKPITIQVSNTVIQAPMRVSVGPAKTHDAVVVTLSIKNMAVGSILKEDKEKIHRGFRGINKSLAILYEHTHPHLAVIDAWESMEGNGPYHGNKVETHFAVASTNSIAADTLVAELMGFNPLQIGYLNMLGAEKIKAQTEIVGKSREGFQFHFRPHKTYLEQINWM